jgi:SNF2 family DNA or RNA helicase
VLYEHQKTAIRNCIEKKRYALYHEQGLGKTITAILSSDYVLSKTEKNKRVIVICPAFLQPNWQREIEKWSKFQEFYKIYSYETFWRLPAQAQRCGVLIADEAHYIKNRRAKRTEAVVNAAIAAERVILLTGTPIGNRNILDLYTHLVCLDPTNQYSVYRNFRQQFMRMKTHKFQKDESRNEDEFLKLLAPMSERKLKVDCLDLPEKIYHEFSCKGTRVHQGLHVIHKMQAQEGFDFDVTDKSSGELVEAIKSTSEKLTVLVDLVENIGNKQIVIYVAFRKSIDLIAKRIIKAGIVDNVLTFHGDLTPLTKEDMLNKFTSGKCKILIATMQSMNVGVTLTNCSEVIYYSRTFSCTERAQSEDRFHRIGQRNVVNYYDIIANGVDRKAFEMIKQNKSYDEIKKEVEDAE